MTMTGSGPHVAVEGLQGVGSHRKRPLSPPLPEDQGEAVMPVDVLELEAGDLGQVGCRRRAARGPAPCGGGRGPGLEQVEHDGLDVLPLDGLHVEGQVRALQEAGKLLGGLAVGLDRLPALPRAQVEHPRVHQAS
jgi:hypothetical protein